MSPMEKGGIEFAETCYSGLMSDSWRIADLPEELQVELRDRLAQAKRGEGLIGIEAALSQAEKTTEEILSVLRNGRAAS